MQGEYYIVLVKSNMHFRGTHKNFQLKLENVITSKCGYREFYDIQGKYSLLLDDQFNRQQVGESGAVETVQHATAK